MRRRTFIAGAFAAAAIAALPSTATARRVTMTTPYRAFRPESYWNTPLPVDAPLDALSAAYIADAKKNSGAGMGLTMGSFAQPFYWATATDPLQTITAAGKTVTIHVPANAAPMNSSDAELTIFDLSLNLCVGFHAATRSSTGKITAGGLDRWHLDSNGLDGKLAQSDDKFNSGHRGSPAPLRGIRLDEVKAGLIPHKLAAFWWATGPGHVFPMAGDEGAKGGTIMEGMVCRINPAVDLTTYYPAGTANYVIAKCFQDYGCYVGDNSGSGSRVKVERSNAWTAMGVTPKSLLKVPWSSWQFVARGFGG